MIKIFSAKVPLTPNSPPLPNSQRNDKQSSESDGHIRNFEPHFFITFRTKLPPSV